MTERLRDLVRGRLVRPKRWLHRRYISQSSMRPAMLLRARFGLRRGLTRDHAVDEVARCLSRGWGNQRYAAAPKLLEALIHDVRTTTASVMELGGGVSTVVLASANLVLGTEVITVDHDPTWVRAIRRRLSLLLLPSEHVVHRPLVKCGDYDWYGLHPADLPSQIGVLLCDGPPSSTRGGRSGVLELIDQGARPDVIIVDDTHRAAERHLVAQLEMRGYDSATHEAGNGRAFTRLTTRSGRH